MHNGGTLEGRARRLFVKLFQEVGPVGALRCLATKRRYVQLHKAYGFDDWHVRAPYWCRRYKREAVNIVNALDPAVVVEVGCGLGEIIRRIRAPFRYGVDRDNEVIDAAKSLTSDVEFSSGTLESLGLVHDGEPIDVLIALNWLHGLSKEAILGLVRPHLYRVRYLLLDEVTCPGRTQIRHDFGEVFGQEATVIESSSRDSDHRVVLLRVGPVGMKRERNG